MGGAELTAVITEWLKRPVSDFATEYVASVGAAIGTSVGLIRKRNEDRAVIFRYTPADAAEEALVAFIVCDGMGGMKDGETCAQLAVSHFLTSLILSPLALGRRLQQALVRANEAIYARYRGEGGSTLSAAVLDRRGLLQWIHVGDSRIYAFTKENARDPLRPITKDDTIGAKLRELKGISKSEAREIPHAEDIAQFVGIGTGLQPQYSEHRLSSAGFRGLVISTDGVHAAVGEHLSPLLHFAADAREAAQKLLLLARWTGGRDNASLIYCPSLKDAVPPEASALHGRIEVWDSHGKLDLVLPFLAMEPPPPVAPDTRSYVEDLVDRFSETVAVAKRARKASKETRKTQTTKARKSQKQPELNIQFVPGDDSKETD